jgi:hypothetical protein
MVPYVLGLLAVGFVRARVRTPGLAKRGDGRRTDAIGELPGYQLDSTGTAFVGESLMVGVGGCLSG